MRITKGEQKVGGRSKKEFEDVVGAVAGCADKIESARRGVCRYTTDRRNSHPGT